MKTTRRHPIWFHAYFDHPFGVAFTVFFRSNLSRQTSGTRAVPRRPLEASEAMSSTFLCPGFSFGDVCCSLAPPPFIYIYMYIYIYISFIQKRTVSCSCLLADLFCRFLPLCMLLLLAVQNLQRCCFICYWLLSSRVFLLRTTQRIPFWGPSSF